MRLCSHRPFFDILAPVLHITQPIMKNQTAQAITEVLAAIETLKGEVIRLQEELTAQEQMNEDSFEFIRREITKRALDAVYFDEDELLTLDIDQSGLRAEMYCELDSDRAKDMMEQAISDAFFELKDELGRDNPSVTEED
jgi:hypothetical protein